MCTRQPAEEERPPAVVELSYRMLARLPMGSSSNRTAALVLTGLIYSSIVLGLFLFPLSNLFSGHRAFRVLAMIDLLLIPLLLGVSELDEGALFLSFVFACIISFVGMDAIPLFGEMIRGGWILTVLPAVMVFMFHFLLTLIPVFLFWGIEVVLGWFTRSSHEPKPGV